MRCCGISIYGNKLKEEQIKEIVYADCSLSHPNKSVMDAETCYSICLSNLIRTGDVKESLSKAKNWVVLNAEKEVLEWFTMAEKSEDIPFHPQCLSFNFF